jgi:hypothetical protein
MIAVAPVILAAEVSLAIWLLVKGIDPERWSRRQPGTRSPAPATAVG